MRSEGDDVSYEERLALAEKLGLPIEKVSYQMVMDQWEKDRNK